MHITTWNILVSNEYNTTITSLQRCQIHLFNARQIGNPYYSKFYIVGTKYEFYEKEKGVLTFGIVPRTNK